MIKYVMPFLLTNINQISKDFINNNDLLLEGSVFDCQELFEEEKWNLIENNIKFIQHSFNGKLYSLHFPTDNANYLKTKKNKQVLYRFIDLGIKYNVKIIVLHSNFIQTVDKFNLYDLSQKRKEFLLFFEDLDEYIKRESIIIGIENLPIIGNNGDDFDSIFVFPEDFSGFSFNKIKIVWDLGHWLYTYYSLQILQNYSSKVLVDEVKADDFLRLKDLICHMQFSSFKGFTFPQTKSICEEGQTPKNGVIDENLITSLLKTINNEKDITMTLEIKEKDYTDRQNLRRTINWINSNI